MTEKSCIYPFCLDKYALITCSHAPKVERAKTHNSTTNKLLMTS